MRLYKKNGKSYDIKHMVYEDIIDLARVDPSFKFGLAVAVEVVKAQGDCPGPMVAVYLERLANGEMP